MRNEGEHLLFRLVDQLVRIARSRTSQSYGAMSADHWYAKYFEQLIGK